MTMVCWVKIWHSEEVNWYVKLTRGALKGLLYIIYIYIYIYVCIKYTMYILIYVHMQTSQL